MSQTTAAVTETAANPAELGKIEAPSPGTCPCCSNKKPESCCLPIITGKQKAPTAEALMRARYSAFVRGEIEFIMSSHHSKTVKDVNREEVEQWSKGSEWLGLKVVQTQKGQASDEDGIVIFHARYGQNGKIEDHWEHAQFEKEHGEWKFLDAQGLKSGPIRRTEPKVGRNDPCSCGSGKKFKKCHGT
jgi:SEC-C motif-containing protein